MILVLWDLLVNKEQLGKLVRQVQLVPLDSKVKLENLVKLVLWDLLVNKAQLDLVVQLVKMVLLGKLVKEEIQE